MPSLNLGKLSKPTSRNRSGSGDSTHNGKSSGSRSVSKEQAEKEATAAAMAVTKFFDGEPELFSPRAAYIRALDKHGLAPERMHVVSLTDSAHTVVDISSYGLGHKRLLALACSLGYRSFEVFKCSGNRLDEHTALILLSCIGPDCMTIDVHHNLIGKLGCRSIVRTSLIPKQNELLTLSMASNELDDECVKVLAMGLKKNHTLRRLNLSHNNITITGAHALCTALKSSVSLWELDLSWNTIGVAATEIVTEVRSIAIRANLSNNYLVVGWFSGLF